MPKVASAQGRLEELNPDVRIVPHAVRLDAVNARDLFEAYDVVVEGSDNLQTKLVANDACVALGRPLVVAGILRWDGQILVVRPGGESDSSQRSPPCAGLYRRTSQRPVGRSRIPR